MSLKIRVRIFRTRSKKRSVLQETRAVSEALGFLLIIGIVVSGTSIYLSQQVPEWTKELEAEHADQVPHDFAELDSAIDMAIISGEPAVSTECPIRMSPRAVPPVIPRSTGTLTFDPHAESIELIAGTNEDNSSGNGSWLSTPANFSLYDKYQVITPPEGAQLNLEIGEDKSYDSGGDEYLAGEFWFNKFELTGGTTLHTSELAIHAMFIHIDSTSSIIADGSGSAGGTYDESGKGAGSGVNTGEYSTGGGGAGYGADGGNGGATWHKEGSSWVKYPGGAGGGEYGNAIDLLEKTAGSGGGGGSCGQYISGVGQYVGGKGGAGGGVVFLDAPIIIIEGDISVNGVDGGDVAGSARNSAGGGGGGGSGGCIVLKSDNVTVPGMLYANGGDGGKGGDAYRKYTYYPVNAGGGGGGGGGGRIKVYWESQLSPDLSILKNDHERCYGGYGGAKGRDQYDGHDGDPGVNGGSGSKNGTQIDYSPPIRYYDTGYLISNVTATLGHIGFNASNTSMILYDIMSWNPPTTPTDTNIIMKVRTSICADMHDAPSWEDCPEVTNGQDISDLSSVSDGHKYIQWRAELVTFDLAKTPILKNVSIDYEFGTPTLVKSSGALYFGSDYQRFPDFQLIYAHGATIRSQTDGEFMLFPPPLSISKQGNTTAIRFTAVNLTGAKRTSSGALSTTAKASYQDGKLLTAGLNFRNITIKIYTEHPEPWMTWFNETCTDAGLKNGTAPGEYELNRTGNSLRVRFYGNEMRPVNVWLRCAEASIELETRLF